MFIESALIRPSISISPFSYYSLDEFFEHETNREGEVCGLKVLENHLRKDFRLTLSGRDALNLVLLDIGVAPDDVVTILPSIGNYYVSGCVTKTIEKHCKWSMSLESTSKAILVIHEWGVVHRDIDDLKKHGLPIIEDCAYSFASSARGVPAGTFGDYAIYSLGKFFPINVGGVVCGLSSKVDVIDVKATAYIKNMLGAMEDVATIVRKRLDVWKQLAALFRSIGSGPSFELEQGDIPGVFMFRVHDGIDPEKVKARYTVHGIECSVYYGSNNVFVPCHQNMGMGTIRYIFEVYESMLNVDLGVR